MEGESDAEQGGVVMDIQQYLVLYPLLVGESTTNHVLLLTLDQFRLHAFNLLLCFAVEL